MSTLLKPLWFNGSLLNDPVISLDPADRGLLLGDGAFETLAVFNGIAIDLELHVGRLMQASDLLSLNIARKDVDRGVKSLLEAHGGINAVMRITASRGAVPRGFAADGNSPALLITLTSWALGTLNQPVNLMTSAIRRNETSPGSRLKLLSYADNILAAREAHKAGSGDALLLNSRGLVACATTANIVSVRDGKLLTPPSADGALPGIVLRHLNTQSKSILPHELVESDGVFLTNSLRLVRPVISIDGKTLSTSAETTIAAIFAEQCRRIENQCGRDPRAVDAGEM